MGGTEILAPMIASLSVNSPNNYQKNIFLLTDGCVTKPEEMI